MCLGRHTDERLAAPEILCGIRDGNLQRRRELKLVTGYFRLMSGLGFADANCNSYRSGRRESRILTSACDVTWHRVLEAGLTITPMQQTYMESVLRGHLLRQQAPVCF